MRGVNETILLADDNPKLLAGTQFDPQLTAAFIERLHISCSPEWELG
jgi:hypothetical protein